MLVDVGDTRLYVNERGSGELPLFVLHGGPGLDHTMFGSYLDALGDICRLLLVDERGTGRSEASSPETWTIERQAADVEVLASELGLERYAVLGHSYGAFLALQHAVDFPGKPVATIVSSGLPDARYLERVEQQLAAVEPVDPRIEELVAAMGDAIYGPEVLRAAANGDYGHIAVEERLGDVTHPVLVLAGCHDRTCSPEAAEAMAAALPDAQLVVFERSGHMTYVEENAGYVAAVRTFLTSRI